MALAPGCVIPVVGPSGAGKDSVIRGAQKFFAKAATIIFPRRIVTRTADAAAEDHDSMSPEDFERAAASGTFALWWGAHGNFYGIPASINVDVQQGHTVVFNCSRGSLAEVAQLYSNAIIAEIWAPDDVLVDRIVARGRESRAEAEQRVARRPTVAQLTVPTVQIDNGSSLEAAVAAFCALIEDSQKFAAHPG